MELMSNKETIGGLSFEELVSRFIVASESQGVAAWSGEFEKANKQNDLIICIYKEMKQRGDVQSTLLSLLNNKIPAVRYQSAARILEFAPEKGLPILEKLSREDHGASSMYSKIILKEWKRGRLKFS